MRFSGWQRKYLLLAGCLTTKTFTSTERRRTVIFDCSRRASRSLKMSLGLGTGVGAASAGVSMRVAGSTSLGLAGCVPLVLSMIASVSGLIFFSSADIFRSPLLYGFQICFVLNDVRCFICSEHQRPHDVIA